MSDLLLSTQKRKHFEELISKTVSSEYNTNVDVTVKTNGSVILSDSIQGHSLWDTEDVFDILKETNFDYKKSSYSLKLSERSNVSFQIEREGW